MLTDKELDVIAQTVAITALIGKGNLNYTEIAQVVGCSNSRVGVWLNEHGILVSRSSRGQSAKKTVPAVDIARALLKNDNKVSPLRKD